jgi:uncharacterized membrane protein YkoI
MLLPALVLLLPAGPLSASPTATVGLVAEAARIDLEEAIERVLARHPNAVVVKAETRYRNGRPVHHVRILTSDGRVRTVKIDGVSGHSG